MALIQPEPNRSGKAGLLRVHKETPDENDARPVIMAPA